MMFRDSVFGPWLNLKDFSNDNHMLNYVLQHQVHVKEFSADCLLILFKFSNHYLHFGHEEFCLVTGFRCGELSEYVSDKIGFLDRLFREKEKKRKQVKVKELLQIIDNDKLWCALDDEDAVRKDPKKITTYNLNGFVWALKIWILKIYPKSTLWWAKQQDVIPRGLAWSNFNRFQKTDYNLLFGQDSIPNLVLLPTSGELKADWWVRSQYYFKGEDAPFIQSVKPKCIDLQRCDSKVVDYVNAVEEDYTLVEQTKKPSCSTPDQVDAVINKGVPLVQRMLHVLRNVGSSYKGLLMTSNNITLFNSGVFCEDMLKGA
ncbi:hypothetical protein Tco_0610855 [Tanacetum coccineum]